MRNPDVNKEELYKEINDLYINKGWSTLRIVNYIQEKHNYQPAMAYRIVGNAKEHYGELYNQSEKKVVESFKQRLEDLYDKAMQDGDAKLALQVQDQLNKIYNIYVNKLEIDASKIEDIEIKIKKKDDGQNTGD